ncbi:hypothetical protein ACODT3_38355 [Streptomyces sp. 4.24]|uniref:hypothetical protein n=1 Tax=Streptomyces tritrimontium TaxID=3406573 RepID=UPI003BB80ACE
MAQQEQYAPNPGFSPDGDLADRVEQKLEQFLANWTHGSLVPPEPDTSGAGVERLSFSSETSESSESSEISETSETSECPTFADFLAQVEPNEKTWNAILGAAQPALRLITP